MMAMSSTSPKTFKYNALDKSVSSFRLLQLHPAEEGPLEATLSEHIITQSNCVQYEALSYVWGSPKLRQSMILNGSKVWITQTLFEILRSLRRTQSKFKYLWIDYLCIDQHNTRERNHQVQQMGTIYASAYRVIFYLGPATSRTGPAFWALETFENMIQSYKRHRMLEFGVSRLLWTRAINEVHHKYPSAKGDGPDFLDELLHRPWFDRAWIIQEVGSAKRGVVRCGDEEISCSAFASLTELLDHKGQRHVKRLLEAMPCPSRAYMWREDYDRDLYLLLREFGGCHASIERDRIYALIGLCTGKRHSDLLEVDYEKSDDQVIRDTVSHMCGISVDNIPSNMFPDIDTFLSSCQTSHPLGFLIETPNGKI